MTELGERPITYAFDKRVIKPRTPNQVAYMKAMEEFDIVFAIGPAGTGKTYLAVAAAVNALSAGSASSASCWCARRSRPARGWASCPGDMQEKVDPYLRPLYDALCRT